MFDVSFSPASFEYKALSKHVPTEGNPLKEQEKRAVMCSKKLIYGEQYHFRHFGRPYGGDLQKE